MSLQNIFLISGILFCLLAAFITFGIAVRRQPQSARPALVIYLLVFAAALAYALFAWNDLDFISQASPLKFLAPLIAALPIAVLPFVRGKTPGASPLIKLALRALLMFLLAAAVLVGFNFKIDFLGTLPSLAGQLLAALIWTAIALSLRLLNGCPALAAAQTAGAGIGILILSFIGAAPFALGFEGACLAATAVAFLPYNWYPAVLELKDKGADLLGFVLGGLLIYCAVEGAAAPAVIFIMLLICETVFALLQKLTFLPVFANLKANTAYAKAAASGLNPAIIAGHVLRINVLMILFGCFQVYAPNQFSLPLVCAVVTAWQMYRLMNWSTLTSGLKETNRAVVNELKKNFSDFKDNLDKLTKPTDKHD